MSLSSFVNKILLPLKWRPERKATLTHMVMNLVKYGHVQHHALARGLQTLSFKAKRERIRRFFAKQVIDEKVLADAMVFNTFHRIPKMHLILDRTNWKYGQTNINILALTARNRILSTDKKRWLIETCLRNMKSQGFNLENTHMTHLDRLSKLMSVVSVAML